MILSEKTSLGIKLRVRGVKAISSSNLVEAMTNLFRVAPRTSLEMLQYSKTALPCASDFLEKEQFHLPEVQFVSAETIIKVVPYQLCIRVFSLI